MRQITLLGLLILALCVSVSSHANTKSVERQENTKRELAEQLPEKRIKQHRWQVGYILPQHYRSDAYKIDYRQEQYLSKPQRNQKWYRINQEDILVDTENHQIIKIERK